MNEEQRNSIWDLALLVQEVDVEVAETIHLDVAGVHVELVDLSLGLAPVKAMCPVGHKSLNIGKGHTIVPACTFEFVWEASKFG